MSYNTKKKKVFEGNSQPFRFCAFYTFLNPLLPWIALEQRTVSTHGESETRENRETTYILSRFSENDFFPLYPFRLNVGFQSLVFVPLHYTKGKPKGHLSLDREGEGSSLWLGRENILNVRQKTDKFRRWISSWNVSDKIKLIFVV